MILDKYAQVCEDMTEYIRNRCKLQISPKTMTKEVMEKFRPEIQLWNLDYNMIENFILILCRSIYFVVNGQHNRK